MYFCTADAGNFFINKHREIRDKLIPFIRKAKRVLKVTIKGVHPDMTNDELRSELYGYVEHLSSIRHLDMNYDRMTFYDGTRPVFVT